MFEVNSYYPGPSIAKACLTWMLKPGLPDSRVVEEL